MILLTSFTSSLTLYTGVPLDNTYENTYTTTSLLSGFTHDTIGVDYYRIRPDKNTVKVKHNGNMNVTGIGGTTLNLYNCNYMSFINSQHEGKRFYCFITDVRYVSDVAAEIDFEVDVMMTWLKHGTGTTGAEFDTCFIEREHTDSDEVGEHILPEPIEIQEYYYQEVDTVIQNIKDKCIIVCAVAGEYVNNEWKSFYTFNLETINGFMVNNGLIYYLFDRNGNGISNNPFQTFGKFMLSLYDESKQSWLKQIYYAVRLRDGDSETPVDFTSVPTPQKFEEMWGGLQQNFTPKNNKLRTYPFVSCIINNMTGNEVEYIIELGEPNSSMFGDGFELNFKATSEIYTPSFSIYPHKYGKGKHNNIVIKTKFPVMSSAEDQFQTYKARLLTETATNIFSNTITGSAQTALIGGGFEYAAVGAGTSLINTFIQSQSKYNLGKLLGSAPNGNNSSYSQLATNTLMPKAYLKTVRIQQAKSIDDFFTKFGYTVNRLDKPSMTYGSDATRTLKWKYIKTIGCALNGECPSSAQSKICEIMDNGITFWSDANVGDYTFD